MPSLSRAAYLSLYPKHCTSCAGWGISGGLPAGRSGTPSTPAVPCPQCIGLDKCPRCAKNLKKGPACTNCLWAPGTAGEPVSAL